MKSNVSNHLELLRCIYIDACNMCVADVSDLRDLETIRSRVENEGVSFLTITLPNFARDFEKCLALGYIDSDSFLGFKKLRAIPHFCRGMLSRIFNQETGSINDDQNSIASSDVPTIIAAVRQICLSFKKMELECTPKRVALALENFVNVESSFEMFSLPREDTEYFTRVSSMLWGVPMANIRHTDAIPRHGPGATAEGKSGSQKFRWRYWAERLEPYFPFIDCAYSISAFDSEELEEVTFLPEDQELPVKVTPVPKTLKGPRIIAIEPSCMQYTQQGLQRIIVDAIESYWLTSGHVNFRDQSVNQTLAIKGSKTGRLATIDLSDASDRVPHDLALIMFQSNPDLRDAVDACRSTRAKLPDGRVIGPLKKFASMGSALCFPVESMYFYTICVAALLEIQKLPVTPRNCFIVSRDVYVYGDDIIVPSTYATFVLDYLQKYNCKVNPNKTFYTGKFRESCGVDAYDGMVVSPTYVHHFRPKNKREYSQLISICSTANLFKRKGYWRTASLLFSWVESILGDLPFVSEKSPILGRTSFLGYQSASRWNDRTQSLEIRGWAPSPVFRTERLDGYAALQKSLSRLEGLKDLLSPRDPLHLERFALHDAVTLKRRWVASLY